MRLDHLLDVKAAEMPNRLALMDASGQKCTYRELQQRSDLVAQRLSALGVGPGDRVGICAQKCISTLEALFGILKAGAAYVPVDLDAPIRRNAAILKDCAVRIIVVDPKRWNSLHEALEDIGFSTCLIGTLLEFGLIMARSPTARADTNLAYILYTSGSTGMPKGVVHTHTSALAFIDWCSGEFQPSEHDRFGSHAPLHFDLSIFDIYVALKSGAAVRLINADEATNPRAVASILETERLTVWYSTPTMLRALVEYGKLHELETSSLRLVCFAGEVLPVKHLRTLAKLFPLAGFYNLYGPTETNVCAFHRVDAPRNHPDLVPIPIGVASSGDELKVITPDGRLVRQGEEGQLVVRGPSVMEGYWGMAEVTSRSFTMLDGVKWYQTGDIVVERLDGALVFRGRMDRMIKRRGYRIELGEIEVALSHHKCISQAGVVALPDADGDMHIVASFVCMSAVAPTFLELKRYCSVTLPAYMSPDMFYALGALPSTSTGKVDYRRLQEMAIEFLAK